VRSTRNPQIARLLQRTLYGRSRNGWSYRHCTSGLRQDDQRRYRLVGKTDEIGHKAAVNKVSINDLHATILHLMGMDHERLTYFANGRNFRLTDVAGEVVRDVIA